MFDPSVSLKIKMMIIKVQSGGQKNVEIDAMSAKATKKQNKSQYFRSLMFGTMDVAKKPGKAWNFQIKTHKYMFNI